MRRVRLEAAFEEGGLGLPGLKPSEEKGSHKARILVALRKGPRTLHSLTASFGRGTRPELERLMDAGFVEKIVDAVGGSKPRKARYARLSRKPSVDEIEALAIRAKRQAEILRLLDQAGDGRLRLGELEIHLQRRPRRLCCFGEEGMDSHRRKIFSSDEEEDVSDQCPRARYTLHGPHR